MTETHLIPSFKTLAEEAEFWDTHDTTDFEAEFTPVNVRFSHLSAKGLTAEDVG